jgi:hypothetical protein
MRKGKKRPRVLEEHPLPKEPGNDPRAQVGEERDRVPAGLKVHPAPLLGRPLGSS